MFIYVKIKYSARIIRCWSDYRWLIFHLWPCSSQHQYDQASSSRSVWCGKGQGWAFQRTLHHPTTGLNLFCLFTQGSVACRVVCRLRSLECIGSAVKKKLIIHAINVNTYRCLFLANTSTWTLYPTSNWLCCWREQEQIPGNNPKSIGFRWLMIFFSFLKKFKCS